MTTRTRTTGRTTTRTTTRTTGRTTGRTTDARRGTRVALALAGLPLALGACSALGDTPAAEQEEPAIDARPVTSARGLDLPLARYLASAADEKAYFAAVNVAQRRCAERYDVATTIPLTQQPPLRELATERRYGLVDAAEAERYGYRPAPTAGADDDDKSTGWDPDERERLVMQGTDAAGGPVDTDPVSGEPLPENGCSTEGFRELDQGATPPPLNPVAEDLLMQAWDLTMADSRALDAANQWADCMAERGYEFEHRWDAGNSVAGQDEQTQVAMAVLDMTCAEKTDYLSTWYAVDRAYQERLIAEHQGELDAVLADHRSVLGRVHDLLQEGA